MRPSEKKTGSGKRPKGRIVGLFTLALVAFAVGFIIPRGCQPNRSVYPTDSNEITAADSLTSSENEGEMENEQSGGLNRVPRIPTKELFASPFRKAYRISPSGEWISFLELKDNRFELTVQRIGSDKTQTLTESHPEEIDSYFWANDERLVFISDLKGDENWQMYGVNKYGGSIAKLTPGEGERAHLIDKLDAEPQTILISLNLRNRKHFDVYRMDAYNGALKLIEQNPGDVTDWLTDHNGVVRVAVGNSLRYRENEDASWQNYPANSPANQSSPLFFTADNEDLYVASNFERDKMAIYILDTHSGQLEELLFENPIFDVYSLHYSSKRKKPIYINVEAEKPYKHFMDSAYAELNGRIASRLSSDSFEILDSNRAEDRMLVRTKSDLDHGECYFYDARNDELALLFDYSPWLEPKYMANTKPIQYQSKDGLTIHGYLTLPKDSAGVNLPTIIYPHGGPWTRDVWRYDPTVQFFANRGYAVLQMNFRGSAGYGKAFLQAGYKQWGFAMQDDITDGVLWLIEEGIANPDRIAIYGSSYGGYAALAGLTFTPDLYQAGVMVSGISDLKRLLNDTPEYWEPFKNSLYLKIGHPIEDEELLRAASPIFHTDNIEAPLLVAHGWHDVRTRYWQGADVVKALRERGAQVEFIQFDAEGHSFKNMESLTKFYDQLEDFLERHL